MPDAAFEGDQEDPMIRERYVNPFNDFRFKRLFGEEPHKELLVDFLNELLKGEQALIAQLETHFDKWLYVLRNLSDLTDRPPRLQERIFQRLFEAAEITHFSLDQREGHRGRPQAFREGYE